MSDIKLRNRNKSEVKIIEKKSPKSKQSEVIEFDDEPETDGPIYYTACSVQIEHKDLDSLKEGQYLNDTIIHFYLNYLKTKLVPHEISSRVQLFDSFFYSQIAKTYTEKINPQNVKKLRQWFVDIDIFRKDYLIFPICKRNHWFVIIVCHPMAVRALGEDDDDEVDVIDVETVKKPTIIILDSLRIIDPSLSLKIRDFLDYEWRQTRPDIVKKFDYYEMDEIFPTFPKQKNTYDCGLYMLMYCRYFLTDPDKVFSELVQNDSESMKQMNKDIANLIAINTRHSIKALIFDQSRFS